MTDKKIWQKSVIVGLAVLAIDFYAHKTIANPETQWYFLFKFILGAILAYYLFENRKLYGINLNPFNLKFNTISYYLSWSVVFAAIHGLYYRIC